jgi:hypothetical protein
MQNTTFKYGAIVVSSPLLCKIQLVPLVIVPSFPKKRCQPHGNYNYGFVQALSPKKCNNVLKEIFQLFYDVLVIQIFLMCPTARTGSRYCFGLRGKGGSESKTCRSEFLSSEAGNPTVNLLHLQLCICYSLSFQTGDRKDK